MGDTQRSPTMIDICLLKKYFRQVRKKKSAGVDKITAKEYAKDLDENLYNLTNTLKCAATISPLRLYSSTHRRPGGFG